MICRVSAVTVVEKTCHSCPQTASGRPLKTSHVVSQLRAHHREPALVSATSVLRTSRLDVFRIASASYTPTALLASAVTLKHGERKTSRSHALCHATAFLCDSVLFRRAAETATFSLTRLASDTSHP